MCHHHIKSLHTNLVVHSRLVLEFTPWTVVLLLYGIHVTLNSDY